MKTQSFYNVCENLGKGLAAIVNKSEKTGKTLYSGVKRIKKSYRRNRR